MSIVKSILRDARIRSLWFRPTHPQVTGPQSGVDSGALRGRLPELLLVSTSKLPVGAPECATEYFWQEIAAQVLSGRVLLVGGRAAPQERGRT